MLILFAYIVLCRVTAVSWISQGFWAMLLTKTVECPCAATIKYLKTPLYVQCSKHQTSKKSAAPSSPRTLVTEIWNSSIWFYMRVCYIGYCLAKSLYFLYFLLQRPVLRPHTDAFVCHSAIWTAVWQHIFQETSTRGNTKQYNATKLSSNKQKQSQTKLLELVRTK